MAPIPPSLYGRNFLPGYDVSTYDIGYIDGFEDGGDIVEGPRMTFTFKFNYIKMALAVAVGTVLANFFMAAVGIAIFQVILGLLPLGE